MIDSTVVSAAAMKAVEDKLYGTDAAAGGSPAATAAALPLPDEILQIITTADGE